MKKLSNWFFKKLAEEILKQNPEIKISEEKKRVPISVFEANDFWIDTVKQAEDEEIGKDSTYGGNNNNV